MKRILIICISLLGLIVCSCQKIGIGREHYLIGTWDVVVTGHISGTFAGSEIDNTGNLKSLLITFYEDGKGKMVDKKNKRNSSEFTYKYREIKGIIEYTVNGKDQTWTVDKLTRDYFLFHSTESTAAMGTITAEVTYEGRKKE